MATYEAAMVRASEIGREHGESAATWFETDNHAAILQMLEDGDPEVYDCLPGPDLSGQWADGYSPRSLFEDSTGADAHAEAAWDHDDYQFWLDALCAAYEAAFVDVVEAEVVRVCRYHLDA